MVFTSTGNYSSYTCVWNLGMLEQGIWSPLCDPREAALDPSLAVFSLLSLPSPRRRSLNKTSKESYFTGKKVKKLLKPKSSSHKKSPLTIPASCQLTLGTTSTVRGSSSSMVSEESEVARENSTGVPSSTQALGASLNTPVLVLGSAGGQTG